MALHKLRAALNFDRLGGQQDGEGKAIVDLGWANSWPKDPDIIVKCKTAGHHKIVRTNLDSSQHGLDTLVQCHTCGYQYHYDSSD
jgi:hypothetical protein